MAKQLTALIIMDGFGLSNIKDANAVEMADTPTLTDCGQPIPMWQYMPAA